MATATEEPLEGTVTVLFTDVEGSTELRNRLGDAAAQSLIKAHEEIVRDAVGGHGGREVKALGDGFMVAFSSARRAVACAIAIQKALHQRNQRNGGELLSIRIGLNAGEVTEDDGDLFGASVNAASRVAAKARGGEIMVAAVVKQLAGKVPGSGYVDRGRFRLKGFDERWQLFQVTWEEDASDGAGTVAARPALERTPLVGREAERAELISYLNGLAGNRGELVLIGGEPGVGKSRLAMEVIAEARSRGILTLIGRCYEGEGQPPYLPFVEILEQAVGTVEEDRLREALGDSAPEVARLVPEIRRRFPDIPAPLEMPPEQERRYLLNSIKEFVARAAGARALCVLFDDLHWADESSLVLLERVAQDIAQMPLLIIGTYRDVELDLSRPLARTLDGLLRQRLARRMSLSRLDASGVRGMLEALGVPGVPSPLVDVIYAETEGNPFFVEEVFKHLQESAQLFSGDGWRADLSVSELDVPESVRLVVGRRLERLSEATRGLLASAAVIGRGFDYELLQRINTDMLADDLVDCLDEAERAQLLTSSAEGARVQFSFAHELIRQTLLGTLTTLRRQRLHAHVAEAIEDCYADDLEVHAAEIARHLSEAGAGVEPARLARFYELAGDRAVSTASFEAGLGYYESALAMLPDSEPSRPRLLGAYGNALRALGRWEESQAAWREAMDGFEAAGDIEGMSTVCEDAAFQWAWNSRWVECLEVAGRGLAALGDAVTPQRVSLLGISGVTLSLAGNFGAGEEMTRECMDLAEQLGERGGIAYGLAVRAVHQWAYLQLEAAVADGRRAMEFSASAGRLWRKADVAPFLVMALHFLGRDDEALALGTEAEALATRIGHRQAALFARRGLMSAQPALWHTESWKAFAQRDFDESTQVSESWLRDSYAYMGTAAFNDGDWDAALEHFAETVRRSDTPWIWNEMNHGFAIQVHAHKGDVAATEAALEASRLDLPRKGEPASLGAWALLQIFTEGAYMIGRLEDAAALLPLYDDVFEQGVVVLWVARQMRTTAGLAADAAGRWDDAVAHWTAAAESAAAAGNAIDAADIPRFWGMALERRGETEAAREKFEAALAAYRTLGMAGHARITEELLAGL